MDLTRREFLGYTVGVVGMMTLPQQPLAPPPPRSEAFQRWWTMYSDPNGYDCESMRGYWTALSPKQCWASAGDPDPFARLSLLIAPYVVSLLPYFVDCLTCALQRGTTVVIESGAGFSDHCTFRQHRRWLRENLAIRVVSPRDPCANQSPAGVRYIEFTWPRRVKIRDFSRVVPPDGAGDDVIAWAGDLAVATRRRVGKGTLIYLGSPVGPSLWAGDVEATQWLRSVLDGATTEPLA
ncbi:MAG TPA: hypothetical protein VGQ29_15275 [Gemmatimonadales bacterium]|jgi:hypothetical protein|nr:hypothetical protein [Gemmatimonadales bacterium]